MNITFQTLIPVFIFNNSIMGTTSLRFSNLLAFCFHGPSNLRVRWGRLQHSPKELAHRVKAGEEKGSSEGGGGDRTGRGGGERRQGRRGFKQLQLKTPGGSCRPG